MAAFLGVKKAKKTAALYARVSTTDQDVAMQLHALREYCKLRKIKVFQEYTDSGISGMKDSRPSLDLMMEDARQKKFDTIIVYRFDRFARSARHLILALEEFQSLGIDFISYQENIDTDSPLGKALFVIVGAVAELERNIIVERVKSGLEMAKSKGIQLGRPHVHFNIQKAQRWKDRGAGLRLISEKVGVSRTTLSRYFTRVAVGTG